MTEACTGRAARPPVLVTGATGFTGHHLVHRLRSLGYPLRALVRQRANVAPLRSAGAALVEGVIRNAAEVRRAAIGISKICHIAAICRSARQSDSLYRDVNVRGTEHLLEAAAAAGVERFIHCSTVGVHGNVVEIPCSENSPLNPDDIYQETKLDRELRVRAAIDSDYRASSFGPREFTALVSCVLSNCSRVLRRVVS